MIDREATGRGAEALQPVPALLGLALLISAHNLGRPDATEIVQFASWFAEASKCA